MTRNVLETLLGAIVLIVAIGFLTFAYSSSQVGDTGGYELIARFDRVDGLERGADVRISGIKVGTVVDQTLDPETYRAEVRFSCATTSSCRSTPRPRWSATACSAASIWRWCRAATSRCWSRATRSP